MGRDLLGKVSRDFASPTIVLTSPVDAGERSKKAAIHPEDQEAQVVPGDVSWKSSSGIHQSDEHASEWNVVARREPALSHSVVGGPVETETEVWSLDTQSVRRRTLTCPCQEGLFIPYGSPYIGSRRTPYGWFQWTSPNLVPRGSVKQERRDEDESWESVEKMTYSVKYAAFEDDEMVDPHRSLFWREIGIKSKGMVGQAKDWLKRRGSLS